MSHTPSGAVQQERQNGTNSPRNSQPPPNAPQYHGVGASRSEDQSSSGNDGTLMLMLRRGNPTRHTTSCAPTATRRLPGCSMTGGRSLSLRQRPKPTMPPLSSTSKTPRTAGRGIPFCVLRGPRGQKENPFVQGKLRKGLLCLQWIGRVMRRLLPDISETPVHALIEFRWDDTRIGVS